MSSENAVAVPGAPPVGTRHVPQLQPREVLPLVRESVDCLLWFTGAGCAPCRELAPHLDEFARVHGGRIVVRAVDGHAAPGLTELFQVLGYPTLALLHRGARVWQQLGSGIGSVDELEAIVLPMVARLELRRHAETDTSPRAPLPRPARAVRVPPAPRTAMEVGVLAPGARGHERLPAGLHRVPRGARVSVVLRADHRADLPIDLDLLDGMDPGSVDRLEIGGHRVPVAALAAYPAVREISSLVLWPGPVQLTAQDLAAFPRLSTLEVDDAWPAPVLPGLVVNGGWVLPELRALQPVGADAAPGAERAVCDDDAARTARGTVLLVFTAPGSRVAEEVIAPLAVRAAGGAGPTVLVVDSARCPVLAAEHEVAAVPTLLLLRDGRPLWRTASVVDATSFQEVAAPVLSAARLDGRTLPRAATRPRRRLRLPSGPLPYQLHLQPPGLAAAASTSVLDGGRVEVPEGWTTHVTLDPGQEGFAWSALDAFGARDLDALHYVDWDADREALVAGLPTLAGLAGLRTLDVVSDCGPDLVEDLLPVLSGMTELRALSIEPATDAADEPDEDQLHRLRTVLPDTVVNGGWSGLGSRAVPHQRPVEVSPGAPAARHDEGLAT